MNSRPNHADAIRVFISYSRQDLNVADRLVTALEEEGFKVTIDRRDLPYGEEWLQELADFIAGSDTVVALVSPQFIASKACNWELGEVKATNKRLIPLVIEKVAIEDLPESIKKIQLLPPEGIFEFETHLQLLVEALNTDRQWVKEHTRLADRARQWITRNRSSALLLRGSALKDAEAWKDRQPKAAPAPSDEMLELMLASRRAATQRQRSIAVGSVFAALIALGLAGAAVLQWQRAETSYLAARTNLDHLIKDLATEMQNAEGMPVAIINRILKNGQDLAENLKAASGGDMRLEASRAAMFYQFGKTYQKIGNREEAVRVSDDSLTIRRGLFAANPKNNDLAFALAESLDLAGDLERENAQTVKARDRYNEAVMIESALNEREPGNAGYAISLSKTLIRLGDLDRLDKNFEQAKVRYSAAFDKTKGVLINTTGEPEISLQRELTWNYNKLGDSDVDLKKYADAEAAYENGLCIREYLLSKDKDQNDTQLRHDISWSLDKIANVRLQTQNLTGALEAQFVSLAIRRRLVASEPKNLIWRRDAAAALHQIGEIKEKAGELPDAIMFFLAAAEMRLSLKKEAPTNKAAATAFDTSMRRAHETRAKLIGLQMEWVERPYREVVGEEEQATEAKARTKTRDPAACWSQIVTGLRLGKPKASPFLTKAG
jgi:tetratricopeptide (TPR) repeat protein